MTTYSSTSSSPSSAADNAGPRRAIVPVGGAAFAVASFWTVMGAHDTREIVVVLAICAVVGAGVFGLVLPRALREESAPGRALTLSVLALLLVAPAFWSGVPILLGSAGALLGYAGRNAVRGAKGCIGAAVIGALAVMGYLVIYVGDQFFA